MENQTAVEWLINELTDDPSKFLFLCDKPEYMDELIIIINKAKEIEKQQIVDAYTQGAMKDNKLPYGIQYYGKLEEVAQDAEDLYNKTFNKS